jgi:hypothetical protein
MEKFRKLKEIVTNYNADIKAEVVVGELHDNNFSAHEILTHHLGAFLRSVRKDIQEVGFPENVLPDEAEEIVLELSRDGLYDALPEGLFHQPSLRSRSAKRTDVMDELKKHRVEEGYARKFFAPFENEFFNLRVLLEKREKYAIQGFTTAANKKLLQRIWRVMQRLSSRQINLLMHYLPLAHILRGDNEKLQKVMQTVLGVKIALQYSNVNYIVKNKEQEILSTMTLGVNSVLGNSFALSIPYLQVKIGPLSNKEFPAFLPHGEAHDLLKLLQDFFFPAHIQTQLILSIQHSENKFSLNEKSNFSYLGFNTYI